jgi:hypothetical protein
MIFFWPSIIEYKGYLMESHFSIINFFLWIKNEEKVKKGNKLHYLYGFQLNNFHSLNKI